MVDYMLEYDSPAVPFAGLGYDTVMIVAQAMKNSESPSAFSDAMANITHYSGVTGNLSYKKDSHIPEKTVTLLKIQNGTLIHIGDFMPEKVPSP